MDLKGSQLAQYLVLLGFAGVALAYFWLTPLVLAQSNDNLPPRETPVLTEPGNLPPRETTVPTAVAKPFKKDIQAGASIQLRVKPFRFGLWTGVQWQGGSGNWYDVEGWRGTFNHHDYISWFVEQKDFGTGPFRWVVYQTQGGTLLATSQPFYLPTNIGEVVRIEIVLPDSYLSSTQKLSAQNAR